MSSKQDIINNIKSMLKPKPLMAVYFIQDGKFFRYKDRLLTKEECRKIPAGKRFFLTSPSAGKETEVYKINGTKIIM